MCKNDGTFHFVFKFTPYCSLNFYLKYRQLISANLIIVKKLHTAASGACAFGVVGGGGLFWKLWCGWCCGLGGKPGPGPGEWLGGWDGCGDGWLTGAAWLGGPGLPGPCCPWPGPDGPPGQLSLSP